MPARSTHSLAIAFSPPPCAAALLCSSPLPSPIEEGCGLDSDPDPTERPAFVVRLPHDRELPEAAAAAVAMMSSPLVLSLLLFASLTALLVLAPRLSPPPQPAAAADDEEAPPAGEAAPALLEKAWSVGVGEEADDLRLFRRAALEAATAAAGPAKAGPPKVAFLFLTNSDLTFAPLWERYFAGNEARVSVYVHADPSARLLLPPTRSFRGRFVAAKPTRRADASLIAAARRLLAAALLDDPSNAYFALLSQHCVPLHSFRRLYSALFPAGAPAHARPRPPPTSYIEVLAGEPQMASRYAARGEGALLPEVPYERFRIGSQFFTLARRHAVLVVRERRLWRKFRMPCLPEMADNSCYPEENYFPTLLDMSDPAGVARYTLTRVNWTGSVAGHPRTYAAHEVSPRLIEDLRANPNRTHPHMFARKFAPDCLAPLLAIADSVIFKD